MQAPRGQWAGTPELYLHIDAPRPMGDSDGIHLHAGAPRPIDRDRGTIFTYGRAAANGRE